MFAGKNDEHHNRKREFEKWLWKKDLKKIKKLLTNEKSCDKILNVDGESRKRKKTLNLENWTVENKPKPKVNSKLERAKK